MSKDKIIPEPEIKRWVTEYFCYPYTDKSATASKARSEQYCLFLKDECKKPRKSEPKIKVGVCSVGYKGGFLKDFAPIVICPHRFNVSYVFDTIRRGYFGEISSDYEIEWASEVSMGVGGTVDYVAVKKKKFGDLTSFEDFVCVEFQAAGTTGTPWEAVQDLKRTGKFTKETYDYGINWANEFAKTMMQQVYKKAQIIESWKKKIVFVVQDVAIDYLKSHCDTSGLRELTQADSVYLYTYKMKWNPKTGSWDLEPHEKFSTTTNGVRKILAGANKEEFPSISEFIKNVERKLIQS